ncbi:VOC family protein [Halapricum desulfuricans]|uniref:Glyoxalase/fosfomycin resistance/dioxygenase domain-containing protein n=1 Tax=Halapricum desulfuricans TaxID=2841257 RepID=A0A897NW30_9EURY|nr:VOC family protein [Halapricum desulfuricans]QSG14953.1 Uncharacterized protein HSEST_1424 [Halapricum desulfuricans]
MSGIVFFGTDRHDAVVDFYTERLDFDVWLEQPACTILRHGTLLVGFCQREETETGGIVTVVLDDRDAVDEWYDRLTDVAEGPPTENTEYRIYNFFGTDPDGRSFEVQTFLHGTGSIPGAGTQSETRNPSDT